MSITAVYPTAEPTQIQEVKDLTEARRLLQAFANVGVTAQFVRITNNRVLSFDNSHLFTN